MANLITQSKEDAFGSSLSTPVTTSAVSLTILENFTAYKPDLSSFQKGVEIGVTHGYFLMGPFVSLGPLRNSEVANIVGLLSVIGLILILTTGLLLYGNFAEEKKKWDEFTPGFVVGAFGGSIIAFLLLSLINKFF